jgi:hypothetical protein
MIVISTVAQMKTPRQPTLCDDSIVMMGLDKKGKENKKQNGGPGDSCADS